MNGLAFLAFRVGQIVGTAEKQQPQWLSLRLALVALLASSALALIGIPVMSSAGSSALGPPPASRVVIGQAQRPKEIQKVNPGLSSPPLVATVTTTADHDDGTCDASDCTLREAINAANAHSGSDRIEFAAGVTGTINLQSALPTVTDGLELLGPGAASLTVHRNTAAGFFRIFDVNASMDVAIFGISITNGMPLVNSNTLADGGGVYNEGNGNLFLKNVAVSNNSGMNGAGVASKIGGSLIIEDSSIANNIADGNGGGINNQNPIGHVTISTSTVAGNSARGNGGGIENDGGTVIIDQSTITDSRASTAGGGIMNAVGIGSTAGTLTITNSTISGNVVGNPLNNEPGFRGGGIFNSPNCVARIINSTISNNHTNTGGGIGNSGLLEITSTTIAKNGAINGGGINNAGTVNIRSNIIALNTVSASLNSNAPGGSGPNMFGPINSQGHNVIGDSAGFIMTPNTGDQLNVTAAQLNLGALDNYGGPTQTHALLIPSVAIDAGDDCVAAAAHCGDPNLPQLLTDQRGTLFPRKEGGRVDAGAFELQPPPPTPTATPSSTPTATPTATPCTGGQKLADPDLEASTGNGPITNPKWESTSTKFGSSLCSSAVCGNGSNGQAVPMSGNYWAWFGGAEGPEMGTLKQTVVIPSAGPAIFSYGLKISKVHAHGDVLKVKIDGNTIETILEPEVEEPFYGIHSLDVTSYADGLSHTILFEFSAPNLGRTSSFNVDNIKLDVLCPGSSPTPTPTPTPSKTNFRISQVYTRGGEAGATYQNDYVELFNAGNTTIDLKGWALLVDTFEGDTESSLGSSFNSFSVPPGMHVLLSYLGNGSNGQPLPKDDFGPGVVGLGSTRGNIILLPPGQPVPFGCAAQMAAAADSLSYGSATCSVSEGPPAPAPPSNKSLTRIEGGCTDTNNNLNDFLFADPNPRPTSSALTPCGACIAGNKTKDSSLEASTGDNFPITNPNWESTSTHFISSLCSSAVCGNGSNGQAVPRTGKYWAWFGGSETPETGTLKQKVVIPKDAVAFLDYYLKISTVYAPFNDTLIITVDGGLVQIISEPSAAETAYTQRAIPLPAEFSDGGTHTIQFTFDAPDSGKASTFNVDDITLDITCPPVPTGGTQSLQFGGANYVVREGSGAADITVTRTGDSSNSVSVNFSTNDDAGTQPCSAQTGLASARCDYMQTSGTLKFAPGETSKTIAVPITDDAYIEGNEHFGVTLTNAAGAALGTQASTTVTIADNRAAAAANPLDNFNPQFFVRQHYLDFLNREPDADGWDFWMKQIASCGFDANCFAERRVNVSAAYFLSIEFQQTGYLVERMYKTAYGNLPNAPVPIKFKELLTDTQRIGDGVIVGKLGWEGALENNKQTFAIQFVQGARFTAAYPTSMAPAKFVDQLNANAGNVLSASDRAAAIALFGNASDTSSMTARAQALRQIAENQNLYKAEFNRAFVLMQYFGYLRRDPNASPDTDFGGYNFWLGKLNQFGGDYIKAEMVKAFIDSAEYRARFGP